MNSEKIIEGIDSDYTEYIKRYNEGDQNLIKVEGAKDGEHLRRTIKGETGPNVIMRDCISDIERNQLVVFNDELPLFHSMPFEVLIEMPHQLTRLNKVQQLTPDHEFFYAWIGEILIYYNKDQKIIEREVSEEMNLLFHLLLARVTHFNTNANDDRTQKLNEIVNTATDKNLLEVGRNRHSIGSFCCYPILEGYLKRRLNHIIKPDGKIKDGKKLHGRNYTVTSKDRPCSSLGDLLHHAIENEISDKYRDNFEKILEVITEFSEDKSPYDIINDWRNVLLHGQVPRGLKFSIIMNLFSLLILEDIGEDRYKENKKGLLEKIQRNSQLPASIPKPTQFYPPY